MKTVKEIEQDILKITMEIKSEFPELYTYILEMPLSVPENGDIEINRKKLHEYYNSLQALLTKYKEEKGK